MSPEEINLIDVAKRYITISIQVSKSYDAAQAKLDLGDVLAYERLSSSLGTQESLGVIERLAELTDAHKSAVEKVFLACAGDLTQALAALPDSKRADYREGVLKSLHGHLAAQGQFYENRCQWVAAARDVCQLLESCRETVRFVGETVVFADDADYGRFEALLGLIDEKHKLASVHTKQMLDHFNQAASAFGSSI